MSVTIIDHVAADFDPPAFTFPRPRVTPGDVLYAVIATATPSDALPQQWTEVARFQGDQRITILRREVLGDEPSLMAIPIDLAGVGSNACIVFTVQGASASRAHAIAGVNVSDPALAFECPGMTKGGEDVYLGIVSTNGSSERIFVPSTALVLANFRDAGAASIQLLVFEVPSADGSVPAQTVTLGNPQPGTAAALVIPSA